jgi:hypothetical protein
MSTKALSNVSPKPAIAIDPFEKESLPEILASLLKQSSICVLLSVLSCAA